MRDLLGEEWENEITEQLQNPEFRFVLLGRWDDIIRKDKNGKPVYKGKAPFEDDWQHNGYKFDDPKLLNHIKKGLNFGVIGGYGNLVIVDIDDPELAKQLEKDFDTFTVETGSGGKHFYFILENEE